MSWSLSIGPIAPQELLPRVALALGGADVDGVHLGLPTPMTSEVEEQIDCALQAAGHLLSGIGRSTSVTVSLSGHANPGHEPTEGWANDCITASVTQVHTLPVVEGNVGA